MVNTRAASRAEAVQMDENLSVEAAKVPLPATPLPERSPLVEMSANSSERELRLEHGTGTANSTPETAKKSKSKTRRNRRVKKAASANQVVLALRQKHETVGQEPEVMEDDVSVASSAASDAAVAMLRTGYTGEIGEVPVIDERPSTPPSPAVRAAQALLAREMDAVAKADGNWDDDEVPAIKIQTSTATPEAGFQEDSRTADGGEEGTKKIDPKPLFGEITADSPHLDIAASQLAESPMEVDGADQGLQQEPEASGTRDDGLAVPSAFVQPALVEDPIEAMDTLDEAIEKVRQDLPPMEPSLSPQKVTLAKTPAPNKQKARSKPATTVPPVVSRPTAASKRSTPPSKATAKSVPRASLPANRVAKGGQPAARPSIGQAASQRKASSKSTMAEPTVQSERKLPDIPCPKPRPMSLSFPTPPPPPKSTKPPTTSIFALPGEAVAAKLRAVRDERLKKEEDAQRKPAFKARPVHGSTAPTVAVKQTATSKARESLMQMQHDREKTDKFDGHPPKPSTRSSLFGASTDATIMSSHGATKVLTAIRMSIAEGNSARDGRTHAGSPPASRTMRSSTAPRSAANTSKPRTSPSSALKSSTLKPRLSSLNSNVSARSAVPQQAGELTKSENAPPDTATATAAEAPKAKAKEVFNRDRVDKKDVELKRREREEAAKKARGEAAERGRAASRAWAEKRGMRAEKRGMRKREAAAGAGAGGKSGGGSETIVEEEL